MSLPWGTVFVASMKSPWAACHGGTHSLTKWSQKILKLIPPRFIHWRWEAGQLIAGGGAVQVPEFVAARWHSYQCPRHATVNRLIHLGAHRSIYISERGRNNRLGWHLHRFLKLYSLCNRLFDQSSGGYIYRTLIVNMCSKVSCSLVFISGQLEITVGCHSLGSRADWVQWEALVTLRHCS